MSKLWLLCFAAFLLVGCTDQGNSPEGSSATTRERSGNSSYVGAAGGGNITNVPPAYHGPR